jgi:hypothetical protein
MPRRTLAGLALVLLCACEEDFKPSTEVVGLRVLGLRASPAELRPGQTANLSALVVDPSRPGQRNTLLWLGCEPDPLDQGRSVCSDTEALADPEKLLPPSDGGEPPSLPPGMSVIGFNEQAAYTVRADLFAELTPDDARRRRGTVGQVLLMAIAAEVDPLAPREELEALFEKVRSREIPSVVTLFRLRVSEDTQQANTNPVLSDVSAAGEALAPGATLRFSDKGPTVLDVTAPDEAFEAFTQEAPDGTVEAKTEQLVAAWYSTFGRFDPSRVVLRSGTPLSFLPPDGSRYQPLPQERRGRAWVVVRDARGGQSWREVPTWLCDATLPPFRVTGVAVLEDGLVELRGENLSSVLDVLVGGKALTQAFYSPVRNTFEGVLPSLLSGEHPVLVRGKDCQDASLPQRLTVP